MLKKKVSSMNAFAFIGRSGTPLRVGVAAALVIATAAVVAIAPTAASEIAIQILAWLSQWAAA